MKIIALSGLDFKLFLNIKHLVGFRENTTPSSDYINNRKNYSLYNSPGRYNQKQNTFPGDIFKSMVFFDGNTYFVKESVEEIINKLNKEMGE